MDNLLKNDLTTHYGLSPCTINIRQDVNHSYFEIEDVNRTLTVFTSVGAGTARYNNPNNLMVTIIDYDGFLTTLSSSFQHGKKRCDVISYTQDNNFFFLNELKDANPRAAVLSKATVQMISTLNVITSISTIATFIQKFAVRKCCYCNKQTTSPPVINATVAFNRLSLVAPPDGIKLANPAIAAFGFELYEYMGNQTISLL